MLINRALFLILISIFADTARGQITFVSPLPGGILQVRDDHADLRLQVRVPGSYSHFRYTLGSDSDVVNMLQSWKTANVIGGSFDTVIRVHRTLHSYVLYWNADSAGDTTAGSIANLCPGHIVGIAGQSNAQGWTFEMVHDPTGMSRVLRDTLAWQPAREPTGNVAGGPWIVMSDVLYQMIGDSLPIGIVNVAIGGTGLTQDGPSGRWIRIPSNPLDSIYGAAVRRFRAAGSELECLCWIQGEADAGLLLIPAFYQNQFDTLIHEFWSDLQDSFPVYHLQVGGWSYTKTPFFPQVHEAQRHLTPSKLVGTAVGRTVEGDGVHYNVPTLWAVGRMFAGAILREQYGIASAMYPPLLPDTSAYLDSILDGSIPGRYCFSLGWSRDGRRVPLSSVQDAQYFGLTKDGVGNDTGEAWFRIAPDSTRVLIGLRHDSITLDHDWRITYDPTPEADRAPLATIDPATGDTIFATAFYLLPARVTGTPTMGVTDFVIQSLSPNPAQGTIHCQVLAFRHELLDAVLLDTRGAEIRREAIIVNEGLQDVQVSTSGLASGRYWLECSDGSGTIVESAIVIR